MKKYGLKDKTILTIKDAVKQDAEGLINYINSVASESDFLSFGSGEFGKSVEDEQKHLEDIANKRNSTHIIALIDEKIVGTLVFNGGNRPRTLHTGWISLSVSKEYWGKGIGTQLMKYLIDWAKNSKVVRKINLGVRTDNYNAIHIYNKLGFIKEGVITREFQINGQFYDSMYMGMNID